MLDLERSARVAMRNRPITERRQLRNPPPTDLVDGELLLEQGSADRLLTEADETIRTERS